MNMAPQYTNLHHHNAIFSSADNKTTKVPTCHMQTDKARSKKAKLTSALRFFK
jgi:hypothetical protein